MRFVVVVDVHSEPFKMHNINFFLVFCCWWKTSDNNKKIDCSAFWDRMESLSVGKSVGVLRVTTNAQLAWRIFIQHHAAYIKSKFGWTSTCKQKYKLQHANSYSVSVKEAPETSKHVAMDFSWNRAQKSFCFIWWLMKFRYLFGFVLCILSSLEYELTCIHKLH